MTEKIIEIQGLSKSFEKVQAVKNLNLTVRKGEIFSFLGTNGAGTRGIKSHYWVTKNIWGDHVDPYGYLSRFGVTQAKLAHDLLYGV